MDPHRIPFFRLLLEKEGDGALVLHIVPDEALYAMASHPPPEVRGILVGQLHVSCIECVEAEEAVSSPEIHVVMREVPSFDLLIQDWSATYRDRY